MKKHYDAQVYAFVRETCNVQQAIMFRNLGIISCAPCVWMQDENFIWNFYPAEKRRIGKYDAYTLRQLRIMLGFSWYWKGKPVKMRYKKDKFRIEYINGGKALFEGKDEAVATAWYLLALIKHGALSVKECNDRLRNIK